MAVVHIREMEIRIDKRRRLKNELVRKSRSQNVGHVCFDHNHMLTILRQIDKTPPIFIESLQDLLENLFYQ